MRVIFMKLRSPIDAMHALNIATTPIDLDSRAAGTVIHFRLTDGHSTGFDPRILQAISDQVLGKLLHQIDMRSPRPLRGEIGVDPIVVETGIEAATPDKRPGVP